MMDLQSTYLAVNMKPRVLVNLDSDLQELLSVLIRRGAERYVHTGNRTLKDHLLGTWNILKKWNQPVTLCYAGLFHSCYSTDAFLHPLFKLSERAEVQQLISSDAEERVFLFCNIDRKHLLQQLAGLQKIPEDGLGIRMFRIGQSQQLSKRFIADLLVLEMANIAEQSSSVGGWPGLWMSKVAHLGQLIRGVMSPVPPIFNHCMAHLSSNEENNALKLYLAGVATLVENPQNAKNLLSKVCLSNPWIAEPQLFLALIALKGGRWEEVWYFANCSLALLHQWGTPWDKRHCWTEWTDLALWVRRWAEMAREQPDASCRWLEAWDDELLRNPFGSVTKTCRSQAYIPTTCKIAASNELDSTDVKFDEVNHDSKY
jgi:hypothetical protein